MRSSHRLVRVAWEKPLFLAVIEATEEAVYNSMFRATVSGNGHTVEALAIEKTTKILRKYGAIK